MKQLTNFIPSVKDQIEFLKWAIYNKNVGYGLDYKIYYTDYKVYDDGCTFRISTLLLLENDLEITQELIQQQFEFAIDNLVENIFTQAKMRSNNCLSIDIQLPDEELGYFFYRIRNNRTELVSLLAIKL